MAMASSDDNDQSYLEAALSSQEEEKKPSVVKGTGTATPVVKKQSDGQMHTKDL